MEEDINELEAEIIKKIERRKRKNENIVESRVLFLMQKMQSQMV